MWPSDPEEWATGVPYILGCFGFWSPCVVVIIYYVDVVVMTAEVFLFFFLSGFITLHKNVFRFWPLFVLCCKIR